MRRLFNLDEWHGFVAVFVAIIAAVVLIVFAVLSLLVVPISRHYDAAACHAFGDRTERTVRFVNYTYWKWDCITPSSDGKWISTKRLWEETPAS